MASQGRTRALQGLLAAALLLVTPTLRGAEFPENPDEPSAFTSRIDARDYDDRFETVEDVLEHVAGVQVRRFGGLGSFSTASIRGSKSEQVLVLLDGVRLNSTQRGAVDLSTLPLRQIDSIEVLRGGGSTRWGSDAVGGVISITTRRPEQDEVLDVSGQSGSHRTLGGDLLAYGEFEPFGADGDKGPLLTTLSWSRLRSDNDFRFERGPGASRGTLLPIPTETFTRLNAGFVQNTALAKALLPTGVSSELSATLHLHGTDRGQPGNVGRGRTDESVSCIHSDEEYRRALVQVDWLHQAVGPGSVEASLYHRYDAQELHDPGGACGLVPTNGADQRDRTGATDLQSGLDLRFATRPALVGPLLLQTRSALGLRRDAVRPQASDDAERWVGTFFLLQELALGGGRLRLFPAVGFESTHTGKVNVVDPGSQARLRVPPDDDAQWLPGMGAILRLTPDLRLKSNYRRVYRRPNFNELYFPDFGYLRGNPELVPEEGWSFDVGAEWARESLGPFSDLHFDAAWFHRDMESSIEFVQVTQFTVEPVNLAPSTARGWELNGAFRLGPLLDVSGSYTFLDSAVHTGAPEDPPLPHRPRNQVFGRVTLHLGPSDVWAELFVEDAVTRTTTGRLSTDGVSQLDLGISLQLARLPGLRWLPEGWFVSTEWINVNDVSRVDSLGLPLPGRLWYLRLRGRVARDVPAD